VQVCNLTYIFQHIKIFSKCHAMLLYLLEYSDLFYLNPGQPRTLLQLKLVGILMINFF
jgi:hypothetical protein